MGVWEGGGFVANIFFYFFFFFGGGGTEREREKEEENMNKKEQEKGTVNWCLLSLSLKFTDTRRQALSSAYLVEGSCVCVCIRVWVWEGRKGAHYCCYLQWCPHYLTGGLNDQISWEKQLGQTCMCVCVCEREREREERHEMCGCKWLEKRSDNNK